MGLATFTSNLYASGSIIENQNTINAEIESVYSADNKLVQDNYTSMSLSTNEQQSVEDTVAEETVVSEVNPEQALVEVDVIEETDIIESENLEETLGETLGESENIEETLVETLGESENIVAEEVDQSEALLKVNKPQEDYKGAVVSLTPEDRYVLEHLVMGEAGDQGYEGAALVAQCIRDTMVFDGIPSVEQVRVQYKYSGHLDNTPNENVLNAVRFIFDMGGIAVKHRIQYFYAPKHCKGKWHETQDFVLEHGGHKFFSRW